MADDFVDLRVESECIDDVELTSHAMNELEGEIEDDNEEKREMPPDESDEMCCCICIENIESVDTQGFLLQCVHSFHFDCITEWAKVANLCPMCKTRFREIVRRDATGAIVSTIKVKDAKQSHSNQAGQDIQANANLFNEYACTLCGNGDNEDLLLICDVDGCEHAAHTYCIPLPGVPSGTWHCSDHAQDPRRRSTTPATTLATLRRSASRRRSTPLPTRRISQLEARLGIRRGQRVLLPFEGEVSRYTGGASAIQTGTTSRRRRTAQATSMAVTDMRRMQGEAARILQFASRHVDDASGSAATTGRSSAANAGRGAGDHFASDDEDVREAYLARRKRRIEDIQAILQGASAAPATSRQRLTPSTFQDDYHALRDKMARAHVVDTSTPVPTAAKLRLVPIVKRFFDALTPTQQTQVLDWGVLDVLKRWVEPFERTQKLQHPNVIDAVLNVLGALPISLDRLNQCDGLHHAIAGLAASDQLDVLNKATATSLVSRWRALASPPVAMAAPIPAHDDDETKEQPLVPAANVAPRLHRVPYTPVRPATAVTPPISSRTDPTMPNTNAARRRDVDPLPTKPRVVEHIKSQLYPAYRRGLMTKDRFKHVAQQVCQTFMYEASHMSSAVLARDGSLSTLAKKRLNDLIDVATT